MGSLTLGDRKYTYERVAKNRSENVFEMVVVAESRTGELSMRRSELDVDAREELTADRVQTALEEWQADHDNLTVQRVVVEETNRCAFGTRLPEGAAAEGERDEDEGARDPPSSTSGDAAPVYRSSAAGAAAVTFDDVPVDQGEEVEYHVAGPSTSVYGTDSGTVTGVKSGTDDHNILIVETDSGEHRVREDWVVEGDE
jgi:hypothetical protein